MVANGRPVLVTFIALELSFMNYLHFCTSVSWSHTFHLLDHSWMCFCFYASFTILLCFFCTSCGGAAVFHALMGTWESHATGWHKLAESSVECKLAQYMENVA